MKATLKVSAKMKKFIDLTKGFRLVLILLSLQAMNPNAHASFSFEQIQGGLRIIGYEGSGGRVEIPTVHNGDPVIAIGSSAFFIASLRTNFTSVIVPGSITSIEPLAFLGLDGVPIIFTGPAPSIDAETFTGIDNPIIRASGAQPGFTSPQWSNVPIVLGGFDFWRFENGFDLLADPPRSMVPGLGVTLFEVYAFNIDLGGTEPVQTVHTRLAQGQLTLEFFAGRQDVTYSIQFSSDLRNWTAQSTAPAGANGMSINTLSAQTLNGFVRVVIHHTP